METLPSSKTLLQLTVHSTVATSRWLSSPSRPSQEHTIIHCLAWAMQRPSVALLENVLETPSIWSTREWQTGFLGFRKSRGVLSSAGRFISCLRPMELLRRRPRPCPRLRRLHLLRRPMIKAAGDCRRPLLLSLQWYVSFFLDSLDMHASLVSFCGCLFPLCCPWLAFTERCWYGVV